MSDDMLSRIFLSSLGVTAFWHFVGGSTFLEALKRAYLKAGSWFWLPQM